MKEGEQERNWTPSDDYAPMEKDVMCSDLAPASSDEDALKNETNVGRCGNCAASSVMTVSTSVILNAEKGMCEKVVKSFLKGTSDGVAGNGAALFTS